MNWEKLIGTAHVIVKGLSYGAIIGKWLEKDDNSALKEINEFVSKSPDEMVNEMDACLLDFTTKHMGNEKRRLIKFYAFFKVVEYARYQQWKGFPQ